MANKVRYSEFRRNTLLEELQCILQEYPDNEQIIKELLQNAEDAGAAVVKMAAISNFHFSSELPAPYCRYLACPAICFYNDGTFTEEDWEGITMVRKSVKKENPLKVGKFGLGFKSVFHITDYVIVISGRKMLFIDPLQENTNPKQVCGFLDLVDVDCEMGIQNSISPLYRIFGMEDQYGSEFKGSLFWFPLRNSASDLSPNVYTIDKIKGLFRSFKREASIELLFCKSLEKIELYNDDKTMVRQMLDLEFSVELQDGVEGCDTLHSVRVKRQKFKENLEMIEENLRDSVDSMINDKPLEMSYVLPITLLTDSGEKDVTQWLIVHYFYRGDIDGRMVKLIGDKKSKYRPYMGIAAPTNSTLIKGEIFCLLPLPSQTESQTGLPVHVNGFLALDSNRNHIKWATHDQESSKSHKDNDLVWNELMIKNVFPKAYIKFLQEIRQLSEDQDGNEDLLHCFYRSVPRRSSTKENWKDVIDHILRHILDTGLPCLHRGAWLDCRTSVFSRFEDSVDEATRNSVLMVYEKSGLHIIHAETYDYVYHELKKLHSTLLSTSPKDLRNFLRKNFEYKTCSKKEKGQLLAFVISDGNLSDVKGLELIPVKSSQGSTMFETFRTRKRSGPEIFLCEKSEEEILFDFDPSHKVVQTSIEGHVFDALKRLRESGSYQLGAMNKDNFVHHLRHTLHVHIPPNHIVSMEDHQLGKEWLQKLWLYIKEACPSDLTTFKTLSIVPTHIPSDESRIRLCRMVDFLISFSEKENEALWHTFYILGIHAVSESVLLQSLHPKLLPGQGFVHAFSSSDIEKLLMKIEDTKKNHLIHLANIQFSYSYRMKIVNFMMKMLDTSKPANYIVRHMNIFPSKRSVDDRVRGELVSIQEGYPLYIGDSDFPVEFPRPYIVTSDNSLLELARKLGVKCLKTEDVIIMCLDQMTLSHYELRLICFYTLKKIDSFINKKPLLDRLRTISFIKKNQSKYEKACRLFRPDDPMLLCLFAKEEMFPFEDSEEMELLLKTDILLTKRHLRKDHILSTCHFLNSNCSSITSDKEMMLMKANKLMEITSVNQEFIDVMESSECRDLRFIPYCQEPPSSYPETLPWYKSSSFLCSPSELVSTNNSAYLVGSVAPVILSNWIKVFPNIGRTPHYRDVIHQLKSVTEKFSADKLEEYRYVLLQIYKFFNTGKIPVGCFKAVNIPKRYILLGDELVEPQNIYCDSRAEDLRLEPYLNLLPADLKRHREVFLKYDGYTCYKTQSTDAQIKVLRQIEVKHKSRRDLPDTEVERDLNIFIDILTKFWKKKVSIDGFDIALPIESEDKGYLRFEKVEHCSYCGSDRLSKAYRDSRSLNFVHPKIRKEVAEHIGVKSVKQKITNATDMLPQAGFGQSEDLTIRLRNLLSDGYTDGFSVPKEIVQNADDSGATVVRFLYDERENLEFRSSLIDDEMKECQGPALWAYNDRQFSKTDLSNIQKISGGTKKGDTTKIGRFGLGFNAVYNITDVPCFVSGNNIAYFDPHRKFLKDAFQTEESTGILLDLSQAPLVTNFTDQFQPFINVFGFQPLHEHTDCVFNGTLFRFHLRTKKQAEESDICRVHYTRNEMIKLLRMFFESAGNLLLFTQNVQEVTLHYLENGATNPDEDMVLVFKVEKQELFKPSLDNQNILTTVTEVLTKATKKDVRDQTRQGFICRTNIKLTIGIGLTDVVDRPQICKEVKSEWLISWAIGREKSLCLFKEGISDGALPLTAVAIPLNHNACSRMEDVPVGFYRESHLFVYLPMPVKVPFPVHINGSFSVSADRRRLLTHTSDDKTDSRPVRWNTALICDSLLHSYLQFLALVRDDNLLNAKEVYCLWPTYNEPDDSWQSLLKDFYQSLTEREDLKMFFGLRQNVPAWLAFQECTFLDESFSEDKEIYGLVFKALRCLSKEYNVCPTALPLSIRQAFQRAGLLSDLNRRTLSVEAFYKIFLPNISRVELELVDKEQLVVYAIRQENKNISKLLMENKCITSKPRSTLHLPSELVHPKSRWKQLFVTEDERFPSSIFCKEETLKLLEKLGLMKSKFPWNVISLQARRNEKLFTKCAECSNDRSKIILQYIHENQIYDNSCPQNVLDSLSQTKFIPAMTKPNEWRWKWKADEQQSESAVCNSHTLSQCFTKLNEPSKMYSSSSALLVGCTEVLTSSQLQGFEEELSKLGVRGEIDVDLNTLQKQLQFLAEAPCGSEDDSESLELRILEAVFRSFESRCYNEDARSFLTSLRHHPSIKIGKKYVPPSSVVFSLKHDCSPLLYGLDNNHLLKFKDTLQAMGVFKQFDLQTVKNALKQLKEKKESLNKSDIGLACRVALLLEDFDELDISDLYLPDSDGVLRHISELCTDDCPWIPKSATMKFLHSDIPPKIAEMTGIRSKRNRDITDESSEFGIDFGQHEDLTNRIKRILDGYPEVCIMKELLQNADDAGATELHFIKDFREHGKESVFSEKWTELQGPALCVYNDSIFSEKDLEGIQNLGIGSKGEDPTTTGQYGVGFNVVYHLTDVPSFLSKDTSMPDRNTLCVLDPHCLYIPCATKRKPGRRFNNLSSTKLKYPDVFSGYLEESSIWRENGGTMFRFPLRQACSDISSNILDKDRLNELIEEFKHEMTHSLLFLHNVRRIVVSSMDNENVLHIEHFADAKITNESGDDIYKAVLDTRKQIKENKLVMTDLQRLETKYNITLTTNGQSDSSEKLLVVQSLGFANTENIPKCIDDACRSKKIGMLPTGGVAIPLLRKPQRRSPEQNNVKSITQKFEEMPNQNTEIRESTHFGSKKMHVYCYLPLPVSTGLPVHINGHFALDHEARRNIWWPNESKSDLKKEWNSTLIEEVIVPAYASALLHLKKLLFPSETVPNAMILLDQYHNIFPNIKKQADNIWRSLAVLLYNRIVAEEIMLFPVTRFPFESEDLKSTPKKELTPKSKEECERNIEEESCYIEWVTVGSPKCPVYYNDLWLQVKKDALQNYNPYDRRTRAQIFREASKEADQLAMILKNIGLNLIDIPSWIYQSMVDSKTQISKISPSAVLEFLKTFSNSSDKYKCTIEKTNVHIHDTPLKSVTNIDFIFWYCYMDPNTMDSKAMQTNLDGCPLLLTADEYLHVFSTDRILFLTNYPELLPESGNILVHRCLLPYMTDGEGTLLYPLLMKNLSLEDFSRHLSANLNEESKGLDIIPWRKESRNLPNIFWIHVFWRFLDEKFQEERSKYVTQHLSKFEHDLSCAEIQKNGTEIEEMKRKKISQLKIESATGYIKKVLELLGHWNLFPILEQEDSKCLPKLCRIDRSKELVLDLQTRSMELETALRSLKLPSPDTLAIDDTNYIAYSKSSIYRNLAIRFVANMHEPLTVVKCLYAHRYEFQNLSAETCDEILAFIGEAVSKEKNQDLNLKSMIKSLPFYVSLSNTVISIKDVGVVLVLPSDVPSSGIEEWSKSANITLLRENLYLKKVHQFVGCVVEDPYDLYCKRILKSFNYMPSESVVEHLTYIKDYLYPRTEDRKREILKDCLSSTEFVIMSGKRYRASNFYDQYVELFRVMCYKDELPPDPFCRHDWQSFMNFAGMKGEIREDIFIILAERLQIDAKDVISDESAKKSNLLIRALSEIPKLWEKGIFLGNVCKIRFVLQSETSSDKKRILPLRSSQLRLVAFEDSSTSKFEDLCWSSCNIISDRANPEFWYEISQKQRKVIINYLRIKCPPSGQVIVRHAKNLANKFSTNQEILQKDHSLEAVFTGVMRKIYDFLNESFYPELSNDPIIYIKEKKILTYGALLVLDMSETDEIPPYLFKAPLYFGQFFELFKKFGASETLSCDHYAKVLETIYRETKDADTLHPEELSKVMKAVQKLFRILRTDSTRSGLTVKKLYLPSSEKHLLPCSELVFVDDNRIKDRIRQNLPGLKYFAGFSKLKMTVDDPLHHINLLPDDLRPLMLSKVIKESIPDELKEAVSESPRAKRLSNYLRSSKFLHGLLRLLMHERHTRDQSLTDDEQQEIKSKLMNIEVVELQSLQTSLFWKGEPLDDTTRSLKIFLEFYTRKRPFENDIEIPTIYFSDATDYNQKEWIQTIDKALSQYINRCIGQKLGEFLLYLSEILKCIRTPDEIQSILDSHGIVALDIPLALIEDFMPQIGSEVPLILHHLLDNTFSFYETGEYVALEIYDPFVDEDNDDDTPEDSDTESKSSPVYILAMIITKLSDGENDVTDIEYRIDIGSDSYEKAKASRIYKFVRKNESDGLLDCVDGAKVMNWDIDAVKRYVLCILQDATKKTKSEMRRIVKRLLLQYHPDKHMSNKQYFTELTQFIQYLVAKIERGESLDDVIIEEMPGDSGQGTYKSSFCGGIHRRGRRYAKDQSDYRNGGSSFFDAFRSTGPQPGQAMRWIRQAERDLSAASNDRHDDRAHNWVCYKCHQASEKALKALLYRKGADDMDIKSHKLSYLASTTHNTELIALAGSLEAITGSYFRMRYPDAVGGYSDLSGCRIPSDIYTSDQADRAMELATRIVHMIQAKI